MDANRLAAKTCDGSQWFDCIRQAIDDLQYFIDKSSPYRIGLPTPENGLGTPRPRLISRL